MEREQEHRIPDVLPMQAARFSPVAQLLREGAPATAFARAAETLLDNFETLCKSIQPYAVLKLAIEFHRHALFCEVSQDKARTAHDEAAFDKFQEYLRGDADVPVAMGLPATVSSTTPLDIDLDALASEETPNGDEGK